MSDFGVMLGSEHEHGSLTFLPLSPGEGVFRQVEGRAEEDSAKKAHDCVEKRRGLDYSESRYSEAPVAP